MLALLCLGLGLLSLGGQPLQAKATPGNAPGSLDTNYPAGPGPDGPVWTAVALDNGGLLIGGAFRHVDGTEVPGLARLRPDGTLDPTFHASVPTHVGAVRELVRQTDGRWLVGGDAVIRLEADGTRDTGYPSPDMSPIRGMMGSADGRMLIWRAGISGDTIQRFSATGAADGTLSFRSVFTVGHIPFNTEGAIATVAHRTGGGYYLLGRWNLLNGSYAEPLIAVDGNLNRVWGADPGPDISGALAVDSEGRLLMAAGFPDKQVRRFLPNGTEDPTFRSEVSLDRNRSLDVGWDLTVSRVVVQKNGMIVLSGAFTTVNAEPRNHLVRLTSVGTLDTTFDAGSGVEGPYYRTNLGVSTYPPPLVRVNQLVPLPNEDLVLVGSFSGLQGVARPYLARLKGAQLREPPSLLQPPASLSLQVGQEARFEVLISSFEPAVFQWYRGDQPLVSATNAVLLLDAVTLADAGTYWVQVRNSAGAMRSPVAELTVTQWSLPQGSIAPTSILAPPGKSLTLTVSVTGVPPPTLQWQWNGENLPGATNESLELPNLLPAQAGRYRVIARNAAGESILPEAVVEVTPPPQPIPGGLDLSFYVELRELYPEPVAALAVDAKDRVLFAQLRRKLRRLLPDGTPDTDFQSGSGPTPTSPSVICQDPGVFSMATGLRSIALQPDGRILVGGNFGGWDGQPAGGFARLLENGSRDTGFQSHPGAWGVDWAEVCSLTPLPGGRILVSGAFEIMHGYPSQRLTRLLPNGTIDPLFSPRGATGRDRFQLFCGAFPSLAVRDLTSVRQVAVLPDGRMLVSGLFTRYADSPAPGLFELLPDGTVDPRFSVSEQPDLITALAPGLDGTVMIAMEFHTPARHETRLVRWRSSTRRPDPSFHPPVLLPFYSIAGRSYGSITSLAVDSQGRVYVGGLFDTTDGSRKNLIRLLADGRLDRTWGAPGKGPDEEVRCMALQSNGDLVIGGLFSNVDGLPRQSLARVYGDRMLVPPTPRIEGVARQGANLEIRIATSVGYQYQLERRQGSADSGWEPVSATLEGNGSIQILKTPLGTDAANLFRVRRE